MAETGIRHFAICCRLNGFKVEIHPDGLIYGPQGTIEDLFDGRFLCRVKRKEITIMGLAGRDRYRDKEVEITRIFDLSNIADVAAALVNIGLAKIV